MTFAEAFTQAIEGAKIKREGWADETYMAVKTPGKRALLTKPYLYRRTKGGDFVTFTPGHLDLMATDWQVLAS